MTDYPYQGAAGMAPERRSAGSMANIAGAVVSLGLVVSVGVWGYQTIARDVSGIPVVKASADPMRIAPDNPGGELADHQGLAVNEVAGTGKAEGPAEQLTLAPAPAGLAEEDIAQGLLATITPKEDGPRPVSVQPAPELGEPAPLVPLSQPADPVAALAEQLAAGATPLTELAPLPEATGEEVDEASLESVVEPVDEEIAAIEPEPAYTGPGLARSLRPKTRPTTMATAPASSGVDAADAITAALAGTDVNELEPDSLPVGTRLVQIGAFDSPESARTEWARLEGRFADYLDGKDRVIQKATSGGRTFFRLRAHGFADLSDARRFCAALVAQNVDCIPVVTR